MQHKSIMTSLKTKLFNSKCLKTKLSLPFSTKFCVPWTSRYPVYQQTSWMLFSIWVLMYCSLCGSDFKSVSELRLTQAFYTSGHVSGVISGGMHRTFPTVKNPLHLTNQNASRLGQRLRSRAYRNFIGCRWLPFKVYRYVNQSCFVCAGQPATCRDDYLE